MTLGQVEEKMLASRPPSSIAKTVRERPPPIPEK